MSGPHGVRGSVACGQLRGTRTKAAFIAGIKAAPFPAPRTRHDIKMLSLIINILGKRYPRNRGQISAVMNIREHGSLQTVKELRALGVALLHLLTLVRGGLQVAVGCGKHGGSGLHQELTHLHIVAGGRAVQRGPVRRHTAGCGFSPGT